MSAVCRDKGIDHGRCLRCDHDLIGGVSGMDAGKICCSNSVCKYHTRPHPTGPELNQGPEKAKA